MIVLLQIFSTHRFLSFVLHIWHCLSGVCVTPGRSVCSIVSQFLPLSLFSSPFSLSEIVWLYARLVLTHLVMSDHSVASHRISNVALVRVAFLLISIAFGLIIISFSHDHLFISFLFLSSLFVPSPSTHSLHVACSTAILMCGPDTYYL